jgi:thymidylate synthase
MRSNDVFLGLPHDIFCFSMIQEIVARSVGCDVGQYVHVAGSLHLYDTDVKGARRFLDEGFHEKNEMPPMPAADPMPSINEICAVEAELRAGADPLSVVLPSEQYWADLARLFVVFELVRGGRLDQISTVVEQMSTDVYNLHVADRLDRVSGGQ